MEIIVPKSNQNAYLWLDLCHPQGSELMQVMEEYSLHKTAILDSLDPQHLPKLERYKRGVFVILRFYDEDTERSEDSLQKMTKKLSLYLTPDTLISIRRDKQDFLDGLVDRWLEKGQRGNLQYLTHPLHEILELVVQSYRSPIDDCQERLEILEKLTFTDSDFRLIQAEDAYTLIAKTSLIKRILTMTLHIIDRIDFVPEASRPYYNDLKEETETLLFWTHDIQENTNRILQLQISLEAQRTNEASQKTNEIMRFLTVCSIIFMPLNFITGVFGMNFEIMPLIQRPFGFWLSVLIMVVNASIILLWFHQQGWLSRHKIRLRPQIDIPFTKRSWGLSLFSMLFPRKRP